MQSQYVAFLRNCDNIVTLFSAAAGRALNLEVVDVDEEIENYLGTDIKSYIEKSGWKAFRDAETLGHS